MKKLWLVAFASMFFACTSVCSAESLETPKEVPIYIKESVYRVEKQGISYEYHKTTDVVKIYKDNYGNYYHVDKDSKYNLEEKDNSKLVSEILADSKNVIICISQFSDRTGEKNGKFDCEVSTLDDVKEKGYSLTDDIGNPVDETEEENTSSNKTTEYSSEDDVNKDQLNSPFAICKMKSYRTPMKIVGMALNIVRIFVPILIIAVGIKELYNAIVGDKDDTLKKAIHSIIIKLLAGILIFLLPGIVQFVISLVSTWNSEGYQNNFACCTDCVLNFNCDSNSQCNN